MVNIAYKNLKSELKFMYSENNALSIIFQNNEILIGILGEFNNNLHICDTSVLGGPSSSQPHTFFVMSNAYRLADKTF